MSLVEKLEHIIEWVDFVSLEHVAEPVTMEPGLQRDTVVQMLGSAGVPPLPELVELYTWTNGCPFIEGVGINVVSLEMGLDHFGDWRPDYGRPRNWFPLVTMNGDVWIYLDLETQALYSHDIECEDTRRLADSCEVYLDAMLYCFTSGGAVWDPEEEAIGLSAGVRSELAQRFSVEHPWL